jgi:hypothetical protein
MFQSSHVNNKPCLLRRFETLGGKPSLSILGHEQPVPEREDDRRLMMLVTHALGPHRDAGDWMKHRRRCRDPEWRALAEG